MSYVQLFPTHMLSLESVLGFCHRIAKGGDCKIEFNQPSCWLYSVPNLLVFQQLVTLYLGGILVRVVSEIVWRNAQECAKKTRTRDWISRVKCHACQKLLTCQTCQKWKCHASWSTTWQNRTTSCSITSLLELTTKSSRKTKSRANPVLKKLDSSHSILTPV